MKCGYLGASEHVRSWHTTRQRRREWRLTLAGFLVAASLFAAFGVLAAQSLGEPITHSEQGDFRMVIVTADLDCLGFTYELDGLDWIDANPEACVIYAGPWNEDCAFPWFRWLRPRLMTHVISAGAEG